MKSKQILVRAARLVKYQSGLPAIKITFPYNAAIVEKVKTLEGRKYHVTDSLNFWTCPLTRKSVHKLIEFGFLLDEGLKAYWFNYPTESIPINITGLKGELRPFQQQGVQFIQNHNGRAILADEMGLGKTIQVLAWLQLNLSIRPVIIVVPASLKLNWFKEIKLWMSESERNNITIISGTKVNTEIHSNIIIINYDILSEWYAYLITLRPQVLVLDEVHAIKNNAAKRTKAAKKLSKAIPNVIALSGTPIVNRPIEFYNAINLVNPHILPNYWEFVHKYCGAKHNGFGWDLSGATNTQELHQLLITSVMLRRKKADVLKDLPDKVYSYIPMSINNRTDYHKAEHNFVEFIRNQKGVIAAEKASSAQALVEIETLKQLAVQGKLIQAVDWIREFIESGEKLIVMAVHKFVIDFLMKEFDKIAVKIDGSVSQANRQIAVDSFQENPNIKLFIGNIKAAGVGITLTAASNIAFLELPWTPGELIQAEDRPHRIGQKNSVTVYYLLAAGTIEEKIVRILDRKKIILDAVLDGIETEQNSLLFELMKTY